MNSRMIVAGIVTLVCSFVSSAHADPKAKKPVVCVNYTMVDTATQQYAVCADGKKPVVLTNVTEVTISDINVEGRMTKAVVGYR